MVAQCDTPTVETTALLLFQTSEGTLGYQLISDDNSS